MRAGFAMLAGMMLVAAAFPAVAEDSTPLNIDPTHPPDGYKPPICAPNTDSGGYPAEARRRGEEGAVEIRYSVDTGGQVTDVEVEHSSNYASLDNAALNYVHQFHCTAATLNGKPTAVRVPLIERWKLSQGGEIPPASAVVPPVALTSHAATQDDYPPLARAQREEGTTLVFYVVNTDGSVGETRVDKSSGYPDLDAASIEMVRTWRFKPATVDGKPIPYSSLVNVAWKLTAPPLSSLPFKTVNMTADDYPASAKAAHEEGTALIMVLVDENGAIMDPKVVVSTGFPDLDAATEDLARTRWHFGPATFNGKPASATVGVIVVWSLEPAKDEPAKPKN